MKITVPNSPWLIPGITQRLTELHALSGEAELSMAAIADRLNFEFETDLTRNAIIGRSRRLGLPARPSSRRSEMRQPKVRMIEVPRVDRYEGLTIYQLEAGVCRWPLGEMMDRPPFVYCGKDAEIGVPYCPDHYAVSHHAARKTWE
jgi:GcrA cell cycle regulator